MRQGVRHAGRTSRRGAITGRWSARAGRQHAGGSPAACRQHRGKLAGSPSTHITWHRWGMQRRGGPRTGPPARPPPTSAQPPTPSATPMAKPRSQIKNASSPPRSALAGCGIMPAPASSTSRGTNGCSLQGRDCNGARWAVHNGGGPPAQGCAMAPPAAPWRCAAGGTDTRRNTWVRTSPGEQPAGSRNANAQRLGAQRAARPARRTAHPRPPLLMPLMRCSLCCAVAWAPARRLLPGATVAGAAATNPTAWGC